MWNDLRFRLRSLFRREVVETELNEELRFHFDNEVEKYRRAGMTIEEAKRRARLSFGGHEQMKEDIREAHGTRFIDNAVQDLRYAIRQLRANPTFAIVITAHAGVEHRREQRDLQRDSWRAVPVAAVSGSRTGWCEFFSPMRAFRNFRSTLSTFATFEPQQSFESHGGLYPWGRTALGIWRADHG